MSSTILFFYFYLIFIYLLFSLAPNGLVSELSESPQKVGPGDMADRPPPAEEPFKARKTKKTNKQTNKQTKYSNSG
jgi:hypothetical protein